MTIASVKTLRREWIVIGFMVFIHAAALLALLPSNFSWAAVGLAVFLHWFTGCLGVTLGWHRLITHRSFQTPKWVEYALMFCGTLSMQGGPISWIGLHRHHHLHSDQENDHHDSNKGFWWSHLGWMLREIPAKADVPKYTKDIGDDPFYQFCEKYFFPIQVVFALLLYAIGGMPFLVWGVFVRLIMVYHSTWLVNSATHKFGYRNFESTDKSTNCWWVALLAYGEGWHNNHHTYQYSARHGLRWWEIDVTWWMVCILKSLGLAKKIKLAESP